MIEEILCYFIFSLLAVLCAVIAFVGRTLKREETVRFDEKGRTCVGEVLSCEQKLLRIKSVKGFPHKYTVYCLRVRCVHPFSGTAREFSIETSNRKAAKYADCKEAELCFVPSKRRRKQPYLREDMQEMHTEVIVLTIVCIALVLLSLGLLTGGIICIIQS